MSEPPRPSVVMSNVGRDTLESGYEDDPVLIQRLVDPPGAHLDDLGLAMNGVGDDSRLRAGEGDRVQPEVGDRHRDERAGDPLPDGDQHVELPRPRAGRDVVGERDELVGVPAHGRDDTDDALAPAARGDEALGDPADFLGIGD